MDEYERMMFWAFGPNWMTINHKKSDVHFKIMHPEIQDLDYLENSTSSIRGSYFIFQICKHYYKYQKKTKNKNKWKKFFLFKWVIRFLVNG